MKINENINSGNPSYAESEPARLMLAFRSRSTLFDFAVALGAPESRALGLFNASKIIQIG